MDIGTLSVYHRSDDRPRIASLPAPLHVMCVRNAGDALASIKRAEWEEKVIREDCNRLREGVATAVKGEAAKRQ